MWPFRVLSEAKGTRLSTPRGVPSFLSNPRYFCVCGNRPVALLRLPVAHHQVLMVNALACNISSINHAFTHAPWPLIEPWLQRLRDNAQALSMIVVPM